MLRTVANRIRAAVRAWLGIVDAPETIEESARRGGMSIANELLIRSGEKNVVQRRFEAPKLLPGVVPPGFTYDAGNDPGGLGPHVALDSEFVAPSYAYANSYACGLGFPGYPYLAELSQRSEYRAPSETIASEMTREWIALTVNGKAAKINTTKKQRDERPGDKEPIDGATAQDAAPPVEWAPGLDDGVKDKVEKLEQALKDFGIRESLRKIAELDGLFGRSQLFIDVDVNSRSPDEIRQLPLIVDKATIPKGSLKGFKVIEAMWTTPYAYNATDPTAPDFYKPRAWFIMGKRTHASRLLTFIMREVPDMLKPAYNFGGLSMTQLMEPSVFGWLRTRNSVSDLIHNFSVMVLKTDMANVLSGEANPTGSGAGIMDRAKLFTQFRDNQGLTVLDMEREDLAAVNVPLAGLDKLQAQAQEHQAAPSHIPLVKLLGITPTGLNASSEGEIKVFYDFVRACQQIFFGPHLRTILEILQLHLFGEIDNAISFKFLPLTAPTVKELAEIRKADAETAAVYIDKGVIAPEEVRERVGSDPDSGYDNLSGDPPPPPQQIDAEHGAELDEVAAGAAHERSEESAEAAHERSLKEQKAQPRAST